MSGKGEDREEGEKRQRETGIKMEREKRKKKHVKRQVENRKEMAYKK